MRGIINYFVPGVLDTLHNLFEEPQIKLGIYILTADTRQVVSIQRKEQKALPISQLMIKRAIIRKTMK